jgi:hypothetical protein
MRPDLLPVQIPPAGRLLAAAEFDRLADVPLEVAPASPTSRSTRT